MLLTACRYLALVYAVGLAIGEAILNSLRDEWQFAPMWIIDYVIVAYLIAGFLATRRGRNVPVLMSAFALSAGVLYMAFFLSFDPDLQEVATAGGVVVVLMGLLLSASVLGLVGTTIVWWKQQQQQRG